MKLFSHQTADQALDHEAYLDAVATAVKLRGILEKHNVISIYGLGDLRESQLRLQETLDTGDKLLAATKELQRQLDEVTAERDHLKAALKLADALINRERGTSK